jgi:transcriptional regulator with XRE-family HTH domain
MNESDQITGRQIAAGRALAGLELEEMARLADVSVPTLHRMETGDVAQAPANDMLAVRRALEAAGVEFTNGGQRGVRMNATAPSSKDSAATSDEAALPEIPENDVEPYDGAPV